jgi:hypothetical protein
MPETKHLNLGGYPFPCNGLTVKHEYLAITERKMGVKS